MAVLVTLPDGILASTMTVHMHIQINLICFQEGNSYHIEQVVQMANNYQQQKVRATHNVKPTKNTKQQHRHQIVKKKKKYNKNIH